MYNKKKWYQYLNNDCEVISWVKMIVKEPGHLLMAQS